MSETAPGVMGRWFRAEGIDDLPDRLRQQGAFLPHPLPSTVRLQPPTYRVLAEAEQAIGRLDEAASRLSNRAGLVRLAQLRDVHGSGELGGVLAALRELLVADLPGVVGAPAVDLHLGRYLRANDEAVRWVGQGGPINLVLLSQLAGILGGERESLGAYADDEVTEVRWRTGPAWLGGPDVRAAYLLAVPPGAELQTG